MSGVGEITGQLIDSMMATSRQLHASGASHFLFINLPPLGRFPRYYLPSGDLHDVRDLVSAATDAFNDHLKTKVPEFDAELKAADVPGSAMLFDWNALGEFMFAHTEAFGITDTQRYRATRQHRPVTDLGRLGFT